MINPDAQLCCKTKQLVLQIQCCILQDFYSFWHCLLGLLVTEVVGTGMCRNVGTNLLLGTPQRSKSLASSSSRFEKTNSVRILWNPVYFMYRTFECIRQILFIQAMYVLRINERLSCNPCCSVKPMSIAYCKCVFVALRTQLAMHMRHIVICGLPGSKIFFHITP